MPETGGLGQVVALLGETGGRNTRLGRACVLSGTLAFVGGGVMFALSGTLRLTTAEWWTYWVVAGILVGGALPALLHGLVLLADTARPTKDTSDIGVLVCVLAAGILLGTGTEASRHVGPVLAIYGLGVLACVSAVSDALSVGDDRITTTRDDRIGTADEELISPDDEMAASVEDPSAD